MKLKSLNIYSFHVRAKTDWLILELISTENIKGYSEITMSNYDQRDALISSVKKLIKILSEIEIVPKTALSNISHAIVDKDPQSNPAIFVFISLWTDTLRPTLIDSYKQFEECGSTPIKIGELSHSSKIYIITEAAQLPTPDCRNNMSIFSTPFDFENADHLEKLGVPAYKIASADLVS